MIERFRVVVTVRNLVPKRRDHDWNIIIRAFVAKNSPVRALTGSNSSSFFTEVSPFWYSPAKSYGRGRIS